MKKSEIKVGEIYHNGKEGRFYSEREVLDEGIQYVLYPSQEDLDCLKYKALKGWNKGRIGPTTRTSFANWAKGVVKND